VIKQTAIIYHVSHDPYNRTEEMKLVWTNLYFDWTNMKMVFKGAFDIFLNTESKYDDCRLLHLPDLELKLNIDWQCRAQQFHNHILMPGAQNHKDSNYHIANFHNYVVPCAPDKTPVIVNSLEHDSYSQFRSENVNLRLSFVCKTMITTANNNNDQPLKEDEKKSEEPPTFKFYASTSRFLERIKNLLSSITRPTKRGKLFGNLKPRKPLLTRHYKIVEFNIDLPQIRIVYWSSANEQYGIDLDARHFRLNLTQKLDLVPQADNLKRRPRPVWSVQLMKFNIDNVEMYLMSPPVTLNSAVSATARGGAPLNTNHSLFQSVDKPPVTPTTSGLFNKAEFDLLQLQMNNSSNERSSIIKLFEAKSAPKNFFMRIDSIYYERERDAHYKTYNSNSSGSVSNVGGAAIGGRAATNKSANSLIQFNSEVMASDLGGPNTLNRFSYSLKTEPGSSKSGKKTSHLHTKGEKPNLYFYGKKFFSDKL
jgi:hypothetical protein